MAFRNTANFGNRFCSDLPTFDVSLKEISKGLHQTLVSIVKTPVQLVKPLPYSPTQLQDDIAVGAPLERVRADVLSGVNDSNVSPIVDKLEKAVLPFSPENKDE